MSFFGFVLSAIAVAAGIGVVVLRNPLFSAFSLIVNLLAVAGLYATLNAHFLAASQVMVYAGAIMVLVLFVLMLLNMKVESGRAFSVAHIALLGFGSLICFSVVVPPLLQFFSSVPLHILTDNARNAEGTVKNVGLQLYQNYVVQFELASLVILVGVVGAVMLANRKKGEVELTSSGDISGATSVEETRRAA